MRMYLALLAATVAHAVAGESLSSAARIESAASAATCPSIESRVDCGFMGISSTECEARGCCYEKQTGSPSCYYPAEGVPTKKAIIVVSNHFDGGYTLPVNEVFQLYWDVYFPLAAVVGEALAKNTTSKASLQWMTQSYLVDLYFNCPNGPGTAAAIYNLTCPTQAQMDVVSAAIKAGYITYHAFPHNGDLELATPSLLEFGVNLTHALDDKFGLPHKTVLSQRDVPGFPRAGLASLNKAGVDVLSEGSNSAMNPPNVPPVFLWKDELSGAETIVEWHALGYGQLPSQRAEAPGSHSHSHTGRSLHAHDSEAHGEGSDYPVRDYLRIPGCDTVLVYAWRSDNRGPPLTTDEVEGYFSEVQGMFPGAEVVSGTLEDFAVEARKFKDTLITVTGEIGDTWLMSAASDAKKLAEIRALQRAADNCVSSGACDPSDKSFINFRKRQLKGFEHTLGLNVGQTGKLKNAYWSNEEFYALVEAGDPDTKPNPESWARQHAWCIAAPLAELPSNHPLLAYCEAELKALEVSVPSPSSQGYTQVTSLDERLESLGPAGRVTMRFEPSTGAVAELADSVTGIVWANKTADGNSSIGLPRYQTLTQQDWAQFRDAYIFATTSQQWAEETYGKPNMSTADPVHQLVAPTMTELWMRKAETNTSVLMRASFDKLLHTKYGCPTELWVRYDITSGLNNEAVINITITAVNKSTTRLSEAAWFTFNPAPGASHPVTRQEVPDKGAWARNSLHSHVDGHAVHSHGDHVHSHADGHAVHSHGDHVHSHADGHAVHSHGGHVHSHADGHAVHSHGDHVHSHAVHSDTASRRQLHAGPQSSGDWSVSGAEAAGEAIHMARHRAVDATPEHLRDFYRPYHADAHYEWSDAPEVRALANSCDSCRLGRRRVPIHETDRSAYQAWAVHKFGEWQDPTDGVQYGGESVQAVSDCVRYEPAQVNGTIRFDSPDAGIVRWGPVSPFPLPMPDSPTTNGGTSFTLWSNSLINTNVPFWQPWDAASFQADYAWRFAIVME